MLAVTGTCRAGALDLLEELQAHPAFVAAVRGIARRNAVQVGAMPVATRWFQGDLGRLSLSVACLSLYGEPEGLTLAGLYRVAREHRICSPGRVLLFLEAAEALGALRLTPTATRRVHQRIEVSPVLARSLFPIMRNLVHGLQDMGFCDDAALGWISGPTGFRSTCAALAAAAQVMPEPPTGAGTPAAELLGHEGGWRVLDMLLAGGTWRCSRQQLATACGISRTQLARILARGKEKRLLRVRSESIGLSEALRADLHGRYAIGMAMAYSALRIVGWSPSQSVLRGGAR